MKVYVKVSILRSHNHGFCTAYLRLKPFFVLLIQVLKKWVKFFVSSLRHLTSNEFTLKYSSEFAEIICDQNASSYLSSLDVD